MDKDGVGRLAWSLEAADISFEVHLGAATKQQGSSNLQVRYAYKLDVCFEICPSVALPQSNIKTVSDVIREKVNGSQSSSHLSHASIVLLCGNASHWRHLGGAIGFLSLFSGRNWSNE